MSIFNCFRLPTQSQYKKQSEVERLVDGMLSLMIEYIERRYGEGAYKKIFMHFARMVLTELILMLDSIISQMEKQVHEQGVQ
jgi:hypothetical protein